MSTSIWVSQKTACSYSFMYFQKLWVTKIIGPFEGSAEAGELHAGGRHQNMHAVVRGVEKESHDTRRRLRECGAVTRRLTAMAVRSNGSGLPRGFETERTKPGNGAERRLMHIRGPARNALDRAVLSLRAGMRGCVQERVGAVLVDARAGAQRKEPQTEPEAPQPAYPGIRAQAQRLRPRTLEHTYDTVAQLLGNAPLYHDPPADSRLPSGAWR